MGWFKDIVKKGSNAVASYTKKHLQSGGIVKAISQKIGAGEAYNKAQATALDQISQKTGVDASALVTGYENLFDGIMNKSKTSDLIVGIAQPVTQKPMFHKAGNLTVWEKVKSFAIVHKSRLLIAATLVILSVIVYKFRDRIKSLFSSNKKRRRR